MRNPWVPAVLRIINLCFSIVALALGASIFDESQNHTYSQRSSTIIAIAFDAVAIVYIFWITRNEYLGKPLGLRSAAAKVRLILLDLFFIVFNSAVLSLAFDALTDARWGCRAGEVPGASIRGRVPKLCNLQRALTGILLISLVAWLLTFSVSMLRYVPHPFRHVMPTCLLMVALESLLVRQGDEVPYA